MSAPAGIVVYRLSCLLLKIKVLRQNQIGAACVPLKTGERMGCFPLFIDLSGKEVLIVGGGKVAERKVQILIEFDAAIRLISPEATQGILALADSGAIRFSPRKYSSDDVNSASLVIAATSDRKVNHQIYNDAVQKRIPVNVVDVPELCTFLFPAIVHRSDLVIGVTTSGGYPALSKYARQKIEELFPEKYGVVADVLKEYRKKVRREIQSPARRGAILEKLMETAAQIAESSEKFDSRFLLEQLDGKYEKINKEDRFSGKEW
jgi:precorrin-2 dehydrogenase/sirohydrochlorin ferrochelatase